jgi:endonuclease/exonuclease/phosphatase family metal-dependent hydrolase
VVFLATHFDHQKADEERMACVKAVEEFVATLEGQAVILAGDLNARPESRVIKEMTRFLTDTCQDESEKHLTFRADRPTMRIDYILTGKNRDLRCAEYRVIEEPVASDHRPVYVLLEAGRLCGAAARASYG